MKAEKNTKSKKILIISPFFPPDNSPQSVQSYRMAKSMVRMGHNVTVICADHDEAIQNNSHGIDENSFYLGEMNIVRAKARSPKFCVALQSKIYRLVRPYDPLMQYKGMLFAANRELQKKSYDAVISIAEPLVSHSVFLKCLKKMGEAKRIVWFSDPPPIYADMLKLPLRRQKIWTLVKKSCANADIVVSVTNEIKEIVDLISEDKTKSIVLPHTFDPDDWLDCRGNSKVGSGNFTVLHSGALYWLRTPYKLVEAVDQINRLSRESTFKLILQGSIEEKILSYINKTPRPYVEIVGAAKLSESLKMMKSCDILCIIDVDLEKNLHLPSKVADYVAARKPILYIGDKNSPTCRVLRGVHPAFAHGNSVNEISKLLIQLNKSFDYLKFSDFDFVCNNFSMMSVYHLFFKEIFEGPNDK